LAGQPVTRPFDVLGLGIVTVDDLLYVESYPPPDHKVRVRRSLRQFGGLTATALVAAARLGSRCAYAGTLGDDDLSRYVRGALGREGIDLTHLNPHARSAPIHSTIAVDESAHTRTIFFEVDDADRGEGDDWPPADLVRSARVLFVDHFHAEVMIRAARMARAAGIPVVADFERDEAARFPELLALADHLVLSRDFAARVTGHDDPLSAAKRLWGEGRSVVVITCGAEGCWAVAEGEGEAIHQAAFAVEVADTTGCGDVFHGVYASALARGASLTERLRVASAAAAIKASRSGNEAGIPRLHEVEVFLSERGA
jgi:sulfofructose kinase